MLGAAPCCSAVERGRRGHVLVSPCTGSTQGTWPRLISSGLVQAEPRRALPEGVGRGSQVPPRCSDLLYTLQEKHAEEQAGGDGQEEVQHGPQEGTVGWTGGEGAASSQGLLAVGRGRASASAAAPLAPLQGIQFLIENDLLKNTCEDIAQFLYKGEGLNKTAIGDYLGERCAGLRCRGLLRVPWAPTTSGVGHGGSLSFQGSRVGAKWVWAPWALGAVWSMAGICQRLACAGQPGARREELQVPPTHEPSLERGREPWGRWAVTGLAGHASLVLWLCSRRDEFNIQVLHAFVELHEFTDLNLVQALR